MRKSPIKHHVRQHQRQITNGKTTVHDYDRGHGKHPTDISKPQLKHQDQTTTNKYLVRITYTNQVPEKFPVTAGSYPEAIELGLLARTYITPPTQVEAAKQ